MEIQELDYRETTTKKLNNISLELRQQIQNQYHCKQRANKLQVQISRILFLNNRNEKQNV